MEVHCQNASVIFRWRWCRQRGGRQQHY